MQRLLLLGLNHTTAPLEVRERLAFNAAQRDAAVAALRGRFPQCEAVLLSTCNRVELYAARDGAGRTRAGRAWRSWWSSCRPSARCRRGSSGRTCTTRPGGRWSSTCSPSPARWTRWCWARRRSSARCARPTTPPARRRRRGRCCTRCSSGRLSVGKQVMHETALAEGRLSVASVAVDYARQIFEHFGDKTVLCVGAGKMAALVLQHFAALSPGRLLVCNRDPAKAAQAGGEIPAARRSPSTGWPSGWWRRTSSSPPPARPTRSSRGASSRSCAASGAAGRSS